jgi:hypothetical protein
MCVANTAMVVAWIAGDRYSLWSSGQRIGRVRVQGVAQVQPVCAEGLGRDRANDGNRQGRGDRLR